MERIKWLNQFKTKVEFVIDSHRFYWIKQIWKIMNRGQWFLNFYHAVIQRKLFKNPWEEVQICSFLSGDVFKGKLDSPLCPWKQKKNGTYTFSSKNPKKFFKQLKYTIEPDRIVHLKVSLMWIKTFV